MENEFGEMRKSGREAEPEECDLAVQNEAEVAVVEFKLAMPKVLRWPRTRVVEELSYDWRGTEERY